MKEAGLWCARDECKFCLFPMKIYDVQTQPAEAKIANGEHGERGVSVVCTSSHFQPGVESDSIEAQNIHMEWTKSVYQRFSSAVFTYDWDDCLPHINNTIAIAHPDMGIYFQYGISSVNFNCS